MIKNPNFIIYSNLSSRISRLTLSFSRVYLMNKSLRTLITLSLLYIIECVWRTFHTASPVPQGVLGRTKALVSLRVKYCLKKALALLSCRVEHAGTGARLAGYGRSCGSVNRLDEFLRNIHRLNWGLHRLFAAIAVWTCVLLQLSDIIAPDAILDIVMRDFHRISQLDITDYIQQHHKEDKFAFLFHWSWIFRRFFFVIFLKRISYYLFKINSKSFPINCQLD